MATQTANPNDPELHSIADASAVTPLAGPEVESSPSNPARLRQLYEHILKCSLVRRRVSELRVHGRVRTTAQPEFMSVATGVGSLAELRAGDAIAAADPILTAILRHTALEYLFSSLYGFESEYRLARPEIAEEQIQLVPQTVTLAAQFEVAAGIAFAARVQNQRAVVMVHAVDGFAALGFWHEAAMLASRERLPLVFVFETDATAAAKFEDSAIRDRAESYGMPGITVEGNDVVAVWRVAQESIYRARSGAGATLIDCRIGAAQRANGTLQSDADGSLAYMQHYLEKRNYWDAVWKRDMTEAYEAEIEKAVAFAENLGKTQ